VPGGSYHGHHSEGADVVCRRLKESVRQVKAVLVSDVILPEGLNMINVGVGV